MLSSITSKRFSTLIPLQHDGPGSGTGAKPPYLQFISNVFNVCRPPGRAQDPIYCQCLQGFWAMFQYHYCRGGNQ